MTEILTFAAEFNSFWEFICRPFKQRRLTINLSDRSLSYQVGRRPSDCQYFKEILGVGENDEHLVIVLLTVDNEKKTLRFGPLKDGQEAAEKLTRLTGAVKITPVVKNIPVPPPKIVTSPPVSQQAQRHESLLDRCVQRHLFYQAKQKGMDVDFNNLSNLKYMGIK